MKRRDLFLGSTTRAFGARHVVGRRALGRGLARRAVTLMEVLLVLIIMVVLAGFGIVAFQGTAENAKKREAKAMIGLLSGALKRYQLEAGGFPSALDALYQTPSDISDPTLWVQCIDKPIPADPWGKPYEYKPGGSTFEILSMGPDGQSGTADDIKS